MVRDHFHHYKNVFSSENEKKDWSVLDKKEKADQTYWPKTLILSVMRRLDAIYDVTAADQKKMYCVERKRQKKREQKAEKERRKGRKGKRLISKQRFTSPSSVSSFFTICPETWDSIRWVCLKISELRND